MTPSSRAACGLLALTMTAAACGGGPSQAEFDQLEAEHELVTQQLQSWANDVHDWQNRTWQVICDIVAKNQPDRPPPNPSYDSIVDAYCTDSSGNGEPGSVPTFGDES